MNGEMSLLEFAGVMGRMGAFIHVAREKALEYAAVAIETEARRVLGTYDYGWAQLAESTQDQRESLGYTPNDPGLRSGEMKDSVAHNIEGDTAHIGSDDDKAVWFEIGTDKQPARSFLMGAAYHEMDHVADQIGKMYHAVLSNEGAVIGRF